MSRTNKTETTTYNQSVLKCNKTGSLLHSLLCRGQEILPLIFLLFSSNMLFCQNNGDNGKPGAEEYYMQYMLIHCDGIKPNIIKKILENEDVLLSKYGMISPYLVPSVDDSLQITIFSDFIDFEKARKFSESEEMKSLIANSTNHVPPRIQFLHLLDGEYDPTELTKILIVTQTVKDYDKWRNCFFSDNSIWLSSGVKYRFLLHGVDKPSEITIFFSYFERSEADRLMGSTGFKNWQNKVGAIGSPHISYLRFSEDNPTDRKESQVISKGLYNLKVTANLPCYLNIDQEARKTIVVGKIYNILLPPDKKSSLFFTSVADSRDTLRVNYEAKGSSNEGSLYIDLQPLIHKRVIQEHSPADLSPKGISPGDMVLVEGGNFLMGTKEGKKSEAAHPVSVGTFYMGKYEVTQALWKMIMNDNPSQFIYCSSCPVENVSYFDADTFIKKLNLKTGMNYRLPSEAEWEYAAKGGSKSMGYKYSGGNELNDVGWYIGNSDHETHPVGQKKPNELGLYDMTGNVFEWCNDWYSYSSYQKDSTNHTPEDTGKWKVLRGGSWGSGTQELILSHRNMDAPNNRGRKTGLRLVCDKPNKN